MADWGRYNTMDVVDPDQMFICPYDPVHVIRACRMPYHLMKCRKNYTNNDMRTCPFNARHVVPIAEHRYHMVTCPDRKVLEDLANHAQSLEEPDQDGAYFKGDTSVPAYNSWEAPPPEEDWDQEAADHHAVTTQSHQDQEAEELTAKDLALMTPAQKKNYKRKLRKEQERKAAESAAQMNGAGGSTKLRIPQNFSAAACLSSQPATHGTHQVHKHTVQPAQPDNLTYSLNMGGAGRGLLMSQRSAGPPPIKRPGPKIAANIFGNSATPVQTQPLTNGHSNGIAGSAGANVLGNSATPPPAPLQTLTNGHSSGTSGPAVGSHGASSLSDAELLACLGRGRGLACLQKTLQSTVGRPPAHRALSDGGMPVLEGLTNGHNGHVIGHNGHVTSPATNGAPSPLPPPRYDSPSSSASDSQADMPVEKVGEAKKKRLYKLQKKLAQIAALEQNASQGRQLSEKEKAKVQTKVALQAELRDVEWELMDLELGDN